MATWTYICNLFARVSDDICNLEEDDYDDNDD